MDTAEILIAVKICLDKQYEVQNVLRQWMVRGPEISGVNI